MERHVHLRLYCGTAFVARDSPSAASSLEAADLHLRDWDIMHGDKMLQIFHLSLLQFTLAASISWGAARPYAVGAAHEPLSLSPCHSVYDRGGSLLPELRVWRTVPGSSSTVTSDLILSHLRLLVMDGYGAHPGLVIDGLTLPSLSHLRVPEKRCTRGSLLKLLICSRCRLNTFILDESHY